MTQTNWSYDQSPQETGPALASASQLNAIADCEGIYHSKYIAKDPRLPTGDRLVIGSVVDSLLSEHYAGRLDEITLDEAEHYFKIERARSADTGATWMLEDKWKLSKRQNLMLKIVDLCHLYISDVKEMGWESIETQKKVVGVIEGQQFQGYVDWIYKDKDGVGHIVDWKVKTRRERLDFRHIMQLSIYAYLLGSSKVEAHYLVPYTKEVAWIKRETKPLSIEVIKQYLARRDRINAGGELLLNPMSRLCSENWCPAWHTCPSGGRRHT